MDTATSALNAPFTPAPLKKGRPSVAVAARTPQTPFASTGPARAPLGCGAAARAASPGRRASAASYAMVSGGQQQQQQRPPPSTPLACGQAVYSLATMAGAYTGGASSAPLVLAAGRDKTIRAYAPDGELCLQHSAHIDRIWSVVAVDSTTVASASADRTVQLWKLRGRRDADDARGLPLELAKLGTLAGHTESVQALMMHQGKLVSASADCTIRMWDPQSRELLSVCSLPASMRPGEHTAVYALHEAGPDGGTLWSGHWGGSLNLWDAPSGRLVRSLELVHEGPVHALQPLPHSTELMASAGADGMVRLWDARSLGRVGELHAGGSAVYAMAATAGGSESMLITAGYDGCLKVWDVRALRPAPLTNLQAHGDSVRALLACDGAVWSGSTDGTMRCWDLAHLPLALHGARLSPDTFAV